MKHYKYKTYLCYLYRTSFHFNVILVLKYYTCYILNVQYWDVDGKRKYFEDWAYCVINRFHSNLVLWLDFNWLFVLIFNIIYNLYIFSLSVLLNTFYVITCFGLICIRGYFYLLDVKCYTGMDIGIMLYCTTMYLSAPVYNKLYMGIKHVTVGGGGEGGIDLPHGLYNFMCINRYIFCTLNTFLSVKWTVFQWYYIRHVLERNE